MILRIAIPGPPGAKGRPRFDPRSGRTYTPRKTETLEAVVRTMAAAKCAKPMEGPVCVSVACIFDVPKSWPKARREEALAGSFHTSRPDGDNLMKLVLDGLNGVAFGDDAQVADHRCVKRYGPKALTSIVVSQLGAAQPSAAAPMIRLPPERTRAALDAVRARFPEMEDDRNALLHLGAALLSTEGDTGRIAAEFLAAIAEGVRR